MSKTALQWIEEGKLLDSQGKYLEAVKCMDEAIALEPTNGRAHFLRGFSIQAIPGDRSECLVAFRNAIEHGYANPATCYQNIGNHYMSVDKIDEAIEAYEKVLEIKPEKAVDVANYANLLKYKGRKQDAMDFLNKILALAPDSYRGNLIKAETLAEDLKWEEAIVYFKKAAATNGMGGFYGLGKAYLATGNEKEAMATFRKAIGLNITESMQYCLRGQCHRMLGNNDLAIADFKKAQEIINNHEITVFSPSQKEFMKQALKLILETEDASSKAEAFTKSLDQNDSVVKKFISNMKQLQEKKVEITGKILNQIGTKNESKDTQANISELDRVKEDFEKKLAELQKHILKVETHVKEVDHKVEQIKSDIVDMKEEINNKLDDFNKKLDSELNKKDMSPDNQEKLRGYFRAFIETFSSAYVTAQVVDSGQVSLDTGSATTTILSSLASFAPFVGSGLSSAVSSIGDFLQSKEMKTNARKMKGMAPDGSALSQLVGKSAFEIVIDDKKQKQILGITEEVLEAKADNMFKKLMQFCNQVAEKIDVYLYTSLYKTPAETLGHNDANEIIEKWLKGEISPMNAQKKFVKEILSALEAKDPNTTEVDSPLKNKQDKQPRTACCNIF